MEVALKFECADISSYQRPPKSRIFPGLQGDRTDQRRGFHDERSSTRDFGKGATSPRWPRVRIVTHRRALPSEHMRPRMTPSPVTTHFRSCNLCEAICGLEFKVHGSEIVSIRGDQEDPLSRGYICPKGVALQDIQNDPDRLRHPVRRTPSGDWKQIAWDDAFDEVGGRLQAIQKEYGRDAVGVYLGNPNVHNYGSLLFGPPLLRTLRTKNRFSATSVDQLPHHLAAHLMFGHPLLLPIPDIDRTQFFLILGANPLVSNGSMMTAPGFARRLKDLKQRGDEIVLVDPRRTETAKLADRHLFIRPGTDAYLLLALLHVILDERLERPGRLEEYCNSLDAVRRIVAEFPPERVAIVTGVQVEALRHLARDFASATSAVCYGRLGVSTQKFGGLCQWLIVVLNTVTGNLDSPGGAMFTRPAVDVLKSTGRGHLGRWKSRVRGLPEFGNELPAAVMAEEIETPGPGQVRALLTVAGNPVLSTPNGSRLERALPRLEFMASIDFYLNETTRHADIILPPTAPLEHDHYDLVFNLLAVRNTAKYSPALLEPAADTRHDWQILSELQRRLDRGSMKNRVRQAVAAKLGPRRLLDLGLRFGPHGSGFRPFGGGLTRRKLERSVRGLDLGPLEPCLPDRLHTADQHIELAPDLYQKDVDRLHRHLFEGSVQRAVKNDLLLIGRRHVRSNNSWMHNFPRLMRGKERCTLLMHPSDALRFGLKNRQAVEVRSRVGKVTVPLEISDEVMTGVVSLPHGWGHHRGGVQLSTAELHPGVSLNDLTDDLEVDALCGTAALNGLRVTVKPSDTA